MLFVPKPISVEKCVFLFLSCIVRAWCILYGYGSLLIPPPCISICNTSGRVTLLYTASLCTSMVAKLIFLAFLYACVCIYIYIYIYIYMKRTGRVPEWPATRHGLIYKWGHCIFSQPYSKLTDLQRLQGNCMHCE